MPKETTKLIENEPTQPDPTVEQKIRTRAYEFYEARGHEDGHDQEDWYRAESEITSKAACFNPLPIKNAHP